MPSSSTVVRVPRRGNARPIAVALLAAIAAGSDIGFLESSEPTGRPPEADPNAPKVQFLCFQVMTFTPALAGHPKSMTLAGKAMIERQVAEIVTAIGERGDPARRRLGFFIGPLAFDMKDEELRAVIDDAFAVGEEKDVAIGFHIEDSMFWNNRKDLWSDASNVEWSDWKGTVVPHRRIGWAGNGAPILAPPMCYNSPAIAAEAARLARDVIGAEIRKKVDHLKAIGKRHLFLGVIAGWETRMQDDSHDPPVHYGYHALHNLGYGASSPPGDFDKALQGVVSAWIVLWDKGLREAGIPRDCIYTHIAFPGQPPSRIANPLRDFYKNSDPGVTAFNEYSRPGFSVYGLPGFRSLREILAAHGTPPWGVAEGTAVMLEEAFGGGTSEVFPMEGYLAAVFNHGGTFVNLFGWSTQSGDMFAKATCGAPSIQAYRKFLLGGALAEASPEVANPPSSGGLPEILRKIQSKAPAWVEAHPDRRSKLEALLHELDRHMRAGNAKEARRTAGEVLSMIEAK